MEILMCLAVVLLFANDWIFSHIADSLFRLNHGHVLHDIS